VDELTKVFKGKKTTQGVQTLFRVTYRTQVNLIRIADNKANMIMGINAMIITVLVGLISVCPKSFF
jgi:Zn/Cd-binding protein ZinT